MLRHVMSKTELLVRTRVDFAEVGALRNPDFTISRDVRRINARDSPILVTKESGVLIRERKIQLRNEMREAVAAAFAGTFERQEAEKKLVSELDQLVSNLRIQSSMGIWAFWPTLPEEPDFRSWLIRLMATGMKIGLPRLNWQDRSLEFRQVVDPDRDLELDSKGLAQPRADLPEFDFDSISLILVPGLAFDANGGRLGRGAGFYDRTLAQVAEHVRRVGICFDVQIVQEVPQDPWDRKVHAILSPDKGLRSCRDDREGQVANRA